MRFRRGLLVAAAALAALGASIVPAWAVPAITGDHVWAIENFDYSANVDWDFNNPAAGQQMFAYTYGYYPRVYYVHTGTDQRYDLQNANGGYSGLCPAYYNRTDILQLQNCGTGTWQQWRSEWTSHGWLIWSVWFANAYPNWCAAVGYSGYEAVVTTDSVGGDLHLACPEGYTGNGSPWGLGQYWVTN